MIPRGRNAQGVCHSEIIREYVLALRADLPHLKADSRLFYRGNPASDTLPSKFQNQVIGEKYLKAVPREICEYLGLPDPHKYRSHSIRHTSATLAAANGATVPQLMVSRPSFFHKDFFSLAKYFNLLLVFSRFILGLTSNLGPTTFSRFFLEFKKIIQ